MQLRGDNLYALEARGVGPPVLISFFFFYHIMKEKGSRIEKTQVLVTKAPFINYEMSGKQFHCANQFTRENDTEFP